MLLRALPRSSAGEGWDGGLTDPSPRFCAFSECALGAMNRKQKPVLTGLLVSTSRITFRLPEACVPQILT